MTSTPQRHRTVRTAYAYTARTYGTPCASGLPLLYGTPGAHVLGRGVPYVPRTWTAQAANLDTFGFTLSEEHMAELAAMGDATPFRYGPNEGMKAHPHFPWPEWFADEDTSKKQKL